MTAKGWKKRQIIQKEESDMSIMMDYSEGLIRIIALQKEAHTAMLARDWVKTCDLTDEIIIAARTIRIFCMSELERLQHETQGKLFHPE